MDPRERLFVQMLQGGFDPREAAAMAGYSPQEASMVLGRITGQGGGAGIFAEDLNNPSGPMDMSQANSRLSDIWGGIRGFGQGVGNTLNNIRGQSAEGASTELMQNAAIAFGGPEDWQSPAGPSDPWLNPETWTTPAPAAPASGGLLSGFDVTSAKTGGAIGGGIGKIVAGLMAGDEPHAELDALREWLKAYENIEDPEVQKQLFNSPLFRQIAQYQPELVRGLQESLEDYETYGEGDAGLRGQEDEALARISERARRGDPLAQRLRTQQAQSGVGRALGRADLAARAAGARRGMTSAFAPGASQAGADYASRVGAQNVLAARGGQQQAEVQAFQGASGVRQTREAAKERALNVRNNYRNAMSNRQLQVQMSNQKTRQAASNMNQYQSQRLHETNLTRADTRRNDNRDMQNQWEVERHNRDVARAQREGSLGRDIGRSEDAIERARNEARAGMFTGGFELGGNLAGGFLG